MSYQIIKLMLKHFDFVKQKVKYISTGILNSYLIMNSRVREQLIYNKCFFIFLYEPPKVTLFWLIS